MTNYVLDGNYIIKGSRQEDISEEEIISLYRDIIEKVNEHLRYHKFDLREGEIAVLRSGGLKETKYEDFNFALETGEITYADPFSRDVKRYAIQEKFILNLL